MQLDECDKCMAYLETQDIMLLEACASVAISRGKTTIDMLSIYMSAYHWNNHEEMVRLYTPGSPA